MGGVAANKQWDYAYLQYGIYFGTAQDIYLGRRDANKLNLATGDHLELDEIYLDSANRDNRIYRIGASSLGIAGALTLAGGLTVGGNILGGGNYLIDMPQIKRSVTNSGLFLLGGTVTAGAGAQIGLYGKDVNSGRIYIYTPNAAGNDDKVRMMIEGDADVGLGLITMYDPLTLSGVGLTVGGTINANSQDLNNIKDIIATATDRGLYMTAAAGVYWMRFRRTAANTGTALAVYTYSAADADMLRMSLTSGVDVAALILDNLQLRIPISGSGAGLLLGGDAQLYRDTTAVFFYGAGGRIWTNTDIVLSGKAYIATRTTDVEPALAVGLPADVYPRLQITVGGRVQIGGGAAIYDVEFYRSGANAGTIAASSGLTLTGGLTVGSAIVSDTANTDDLGSTSKEWANLYIGTGRAYFGAGQDADIYRSAANALTITASSGVTLTGGLTVGGNIILPSVADSAILWGSGGNTKLSESGSGGLDIYTPNAAFGAPVLRMATPGGANQGLAGITMYEPLTTPTLIVAEGGADQSVIWKRAGHSDLYIYRGGQNALDFYYGNTRLAYLHSSGQFWLPVTGSSAGLLIGGDVTFYRSAANAGTIGASAGLTLTGDLIMTLTAIKQSNAAQQLSIYGGIDDTGVRLILGAKDWAGGSGYFYINTPKADWTGLARLAITGGADIAAFNVLNANFQIGSTTVIDSSRVLQNLAGFRTSIIGGGGITALTATKWYPAGGELDSSAAGESSINQPVPYAGTIKNLYVIITAAPGGATTRTFTLRKNGGSQTVTVTIADPATTGSDTAHSFTVAAGDLIDVYHTVSGAPAAASGHWGMELVSG